MHSLEQLCVLLDSIFSIGAFHAIKQNNGEKNKTKMCWLKVSVHFNEIDVDDCMKSILFI